MHGEQKMHVGLESEHKIPGLNLVLFRASNHTACYSRNSIFSREKPKLLANDKFLVSNENISA